MFFQPSYNFQLIKDAEYPEAISKIEQTISEFSVRGRFRTSSGLYLAYEHIPVENARGAILILHGFTEFFQKYYETAWYFINQGYHVFLFDMRGHGQSDREVEELTWTHISSYLDYVRDLEELISNFIRPIIGDLPLNLYSHSMGGAVAMLYLQKNPKEISHAILSSPMIIPYTRNIPKFIVRHSLTRDIAVNGPENKYAYAGEFNPNPHFSRSHDYSYERFQHYLALRCNDIHYQNSAYTNSWMMGTLDVGRQVLDREADRSIETEVLILSADEDNVVKNRPQHQLARILPKVKLIRYAKAKHSIYSACDETLEKYYRDILNFLENSTI